MTGGQTSTSLSSSTYIQDGGLVEYIGGCVRSEYTSDRSFLGNGTYKSTLRTKNFDDNADGPST